MEIQKNFQNLMLVDSEFEKMLTNPILDIAARFWDEERYHAFKVCYKSMREIDDLVDDRKADIAPLAFIEKHELELKILVRCNEILIGSPVDELTATMKQFCIPAWPWQKLTFAMVYDLNHNGFASFSAFLRYCKGAAIAPASIFMHLCGLRDLNGKFQPPAFDIREAARPLAIFSYLVHIMRDFEKDQRRKLNYFADDILLKCGLDKDELSELVNKQSTDDRIWGLFAEYKRIAQFYQKKASQTFKYLLPQLAPKYQLSLHIIYALYSHLYEKIEPQNQAFSETDLNLTPAEVQSRLNETIDNFKPV